MRAAVALGHYGPLLRILLGVALAGALVGESAPQALQQVHQKDALESLYPTHRSCPNLCERILGFLPAVKRSGL